MKKSCRKKKNEAPRPSRPWMSELAALAAEARTDGGERLQRFLHKAKFDERPHLSLTKRPAPAVAA